MGGRTAWMAALGLAMAAASGCIGREKQLPPPPEAPGVVSAPDKPEAKPIPAAPPVFEEVRPTEASPAAPAPAVTGPCGDDDQPPCPLQGWMEEHLQQPLDDDQFAKLAPALERVAKMAPEPSWNAGATGWATFAQAGAAAAKSGDRDALQQSCKGCHKAWRSKYKAGFRTRAIE